MKNRLFLIVNIVIGLTTAILLFNHFAQVPATRAIPVNQIGSDAP